MADNNITLTISVEDESDLGTSGHQDEPLFQAVWFKVTEQISRTYLLRIRVLSYNDDIDLASLVGRQVTLTESRVLSSDNEEHSRNFPGVIWSAQQRGKWNSATEGTMYYYWLDVRPALHSLEMSARSKVYGCESSAIEIPDIITYCLTGSDVDTIKSMVVYDAQYEDETVYTDSVTSDIEQKFVVQYDETDLAFMQRIMERYGIFYYFNPYQGLDSDGFGQTVVISDYNGSFKFGNNADSLDDATLLEYVQPDKYAPGSNFVVKNFIARYSLRSKTVTFQDYDYRNTLSLSQEENLDTDSGEGSLTLYGKNIQSQNANSDGALLTSRYAQFLMSDQEYFTGQSDCFELCPGFIFQLSDHFNSKYNTVDSSVSPAPGYLVTEVAHECSVPLPGKDWNDDDYGHSADFTAIDYTVSYRPPQVTKVPVAPSVMNATVDSSDTTTERADLDSSGRYLAFMKFDTDQADDTTYAGKRSCAIRMSQPYGGVSGHGISFPMVRQTEVLIGFVNGDLNRPVIMGGVPNSTNQSPVNETLETRSRLVTDSAITLELEDGTPTSTTSDAATKQVAAPPTDDASAVGTVEATGDTTSTNNWARLFLSYNGQQNYLRLGAAPSDESSSHVNSIGACSLPSTSGVTGYTEGDRAVGTAGDATEVIGGQQITYIKAADSTSIDTPDTSLGRQVTVFSGGSVETIYGDQILTVHAEKTTTDDETASLGAFDSETDSNAPTADQTIEVLTGIQTLSSGSIIDISSKIGGNPKPPAQVLYSAGCQYLYADDDQYLETSGNQVFEIHGDQTGTVDGKYSITYKGTQTKRVHGNTDTIYYGKNIQTYNEGNIDTFIKYRLLTIAGPYLNNSVINQNFSAVNSAVSGAFFRTSIVHSSITANRIQNQGTTLRNNGAEITSCAAKAVIGLFSFV